MENIERPAEVSKAQKQVMTTKNQQKYDSDQFEKIYDYLDRLNTEGFNIDMVYPVGSIYLSINDTDPSTIFGGEWELIPDIFLLGAGNLYELGDTGGEATHTLTTDEMPSHNHKWTKPESYTYSGSNFSVPYGAYTTTAPTVSTANTGGGQAHNNMPPYLAVYIWKRVN